MFRKLTQTLLIVALVAVVASPVTAQVFGPAVTPGRTVTTADMTNTIPPVPSDIYRPGPSTPPITQDLATFAWLEFIALSAPVDTSMRGMPGGSFNYTGNNPTTTLAWETYQHRSELLPYNAGQAVAPQPWNNPPRYQMFYTNSQGQNVAYNVPYNNYNNLDESSQIAQNLLFFPQSPGNPNPDGDWQVLFEAKVNQHEWQYVDQVYGSFPVPLALPVHTIEVKSAWRPLGSIPASQRYRYHTAEVISYTGNDDNPQARVAQYALIALHIIHKTSNYPTFTFATFEQIDSCNPSGSTVCQTGLYYVPEYSDIAYQTPSSTTLYNGQTVPNPQIVLSNGPFNPNAPFAQPNGNLYKLPLGPVTSIPGAKTVSGGGGQVVAVPVVQPPTTNSAVATVNQQVLQAMRGLPGFGPNFAWQYYQLKGVQAVPTNNESVADFYLANIVVESSQPGIQVFRGGASVDGSGPFTLNNPRNQANVQDPMQGNQVFSVGGCQGCHGVAQTKNGFDFSFLFFGKGGVGFSPDTAGIKAQDAVQDRLKSYKMIPDKLRDIKK